MMTYDEAIYIAAEHLCIADMLKKNKEGILEIGTLDPSDARIKLQNMIEERHSLNGDVSKEGPIPNYVPYTSVINDKTPTRDEIMNKLTLVSMGKE